VGSNEKVRGKNKFDTINEIGGFFSVLSFLLFKERYFCSSEQRLLLHLDIRQIKDENTLSVVPSVIIESLNNVLFQFENNVDDF
jgi:hypothetical protein